MAWWPLSHTVPTSNDIHTPRFFLFPFLPEVPPTPPASLLAMRLFVAPITALHLHTVYKYPTTVVLALLYGCGVYHVPRTVVIVCCLIKPPQQPCERGTVSISLLQSGRMEVRETRGSFRTILPGSKWENWDSNPSALDLQNTYLSRIQLTFCLPWVLVVAETEQAGLTFTMKLIVPLNLWQASCLCLWSDGIA